MFKKENSNKAKFFSLLSFTVFISIITSLSLARVVPRGLEYLNHSSYYWWYVSFWIIIIIGIWFFSKPTNISQKFYRLIIFITIISIKSLALFAITVKAVPSYKSAILEFKKTKFKNDKLDRRFSIGFLHNRLPYQKINVKGFPKVTYTIFLM